MRISHPAAEGAEGTRLRDKVARDAHPRTDSPVSMWEWLNYPHRTAIDWEPPHQGLGTQPCAARARVGPNATLISTRCSPRRRPIRANAGRRLREGLAINAVETRESTKRIIKMRRFHSVRLPMPAEGPLAAARVEACTAHTRVEPKATGNMPGNPRRAPARKAAHKGNAPPCGSATTRRAG